jgi:hypothetical protein
VLHIYGRNHSWRIQYCPNLQLLTANVTCTPLIRRVLVRMIGFIIRWSHTPNYACTLAIQHSLSFIQFTVHCCGLLPPRTSFLAVSCREHIWNCWELLRAELLREPNWTVFIPARTETELHLELVIGITAAPTTQKTSIVETRLLSHCIATVAALTTANPLLLRCPATTSKHSFFYYCVPLDVSMSPAVTAWGKHYTICCFRPR